MERAFNQNAKQVLLLKTAGGRTMVHQDALFKCPQSTHRTQQNAVSEFSII